MNQRTTNGLLVAAVVLLSANLAAHVGLIPAARAAASDVVSDVIRARLIELVATDGRVVGQLHTSDDGSGNLRLRGGNGEVRVKLGATKDGSGLILLDNNTEPALWLEAKSQGTSITLAQSGKPKRVIVP
jgi:hypothetical protein